MILRDPYFPPWTEEEVKQYWDLSVRQNSLDFEYNFPPPDTFAFVW